MENELIKQIVKVGNSAGVILPREWLDGTARIELIKKPLDIRKEIFVALDEYMEYIVGIYLYGSRARGEEEKDSDIDVLVIVNKKIKIESKKIEAITVIKDKIEEAIKLNPILFYSLFKEAKPILNSAFLDELKEKHKPKKSDFNEFISDTERIIKINEELLDYTGKLEGQVYSIVLRLKGVYIIKCLLDNKKYSNTEFKKWLGNENLYNVYRSVKNDKKINYEIDNSDLRNLLNKLKEEINKI